MKVGKRKLPPSFSHESKKYKDNYEFFDEPIYFECKNEHMSTGFNQIVNFPFPLLQLKNRGTHRLILDEKVKQIKTWLTTEQAIKYLKYLIENKQKKKKEENKKKMTKKLKNELEENFKRQYIIELFNQGYMYDYISSLFNKSIRKIKNIIQIYKKTGRSYLLKKGMKKKLTTEQTKKLEEFWLFEENEKLTMKESKEYLVKYEIIKENEINENTLTNYRHSLGFSNKRTKKRKITRYNQDVLDERIKFAISYLTYLVNDYEMIIIDESSFNVSMARNYGWSKKGKEVVIKVPGKSINITLILAVTRTKILGYQIYIPGVLGCDFACFLINLIQKCNLEIRLSKIVFVYDNVNTHNVQDYRNRFYDKLNILKTTEYCPYFKCIEELFTKVKNIVRKTNACSIDQRILSIHNALFQITEEDLINYFEHVYDYLEKSFNYEEI